MNNLALYYIIMTQHFRVQIHAKTSANMTHYYTLPLHARKETFKTLDLGEGYCRIIKNLVNE